MYNYETALRGDGLAAPAPPADIPDYGSSAVLEAYKKENDSLKDMIDVLTKERGSSGILEGKYLAQIKKTKTLTVQLESEKSRTRQLQADLDAALAKAAQVDEDATTKALAKKKGKVTGATAGRPANSDEVDGATPDAAGEVRQLKERVDRAFQQVHAKAIQVEEVKRENAQLRHIIKQELGDVDNKDVDALLKRTISAADTTMTSNRAASGGWKGRAEQIVLLKAKVKELERELGTTQGALQQAAAAAVAVGAGAAHVPDTIRDDGTSSAAFGLANTAGFGGEAADVNDVASWLSLAARTNGGGGGGGGSVGAGAVATASSAAKDYEEEQRRRLTDVSNQKLLRIRELEQQLEVAHHNVAEEKRKLTALQARFQTLQRQQVQFRTHVETMLEKSATDDALLEAYKEEMQLAQQAKRAVEVELAEYREQAWEQATHNRTSEPEQRARGNATAPRTRTATSEEQKALPADARRGSRTTLEDQGLVQMRQLLAYHKAEAAALREELATAKASAGHAVHGTASSSLMSTLNAWWTEALASPSVVAALRRAQDSSCAQQPVATTLSSEGLVTAVMAVLLVAHRHVLAAESRQAALMDGPVQTFLDVLETYEGVVQTLQKALADLPASGTAAVPRELLERVLEALKTVDGSSNQKGSPAHTTTTHAEFIKKENAHLRERARVLAEMLEKERQALVVAHKEELRRLVLDAADSASAETSPRATGTHKNDESMPETAAEKDVAERYAALQRQYNDLRKAFNQMQSQSLNNA